MIHSTVRSIFYLEGAFRFALDNMALSMSHWACLKNPMAATAPEVFDRKSLNFTLIIIGLMSCFSFYVGSVI